MAAAFGYPCKPSSEGKLIIHNNSLANTVWVVLLLGLAFVPLTAAADTLKVGGTGSALGGMALLAKAFQAKRPDTQVTIVPGLGSSGSIKAVAATALDIALSARQLKPAEHEQKLVERELARTPLVLASMRSHAGFTLGDLARIYDGTLQTWPDGSLLRPVLRPVADSETTLLQAISPEIERALARAHARPGLYIAITDQDSADAIERIVGSVGTSTLALILSEQRPIKALPLNGVTPSVAALARGQYPYYKPLYLVTTQNPSDTARAFITFARSKQAAKILSDNGYLPLE